MNGTKPTPIEAFRRDGQCSPEHFDVLDAAIHILEAERASAIRGAAMWQRRVAKLEERMRVRAVYTFTRRVDQEWLDPAKGVHYSARPDGTPYAYDVPDGVHPVTKDESPPGLYPVVVVPKELIGEVVAIRRIAFREGERL